MCGLYTYAKEVYIQAIKKSDLSRFFETYLVRTINFRHWYLVVQSFLLAHQPLSSGLGSPLIY